MRISYQAFFGSLFFSRLADQILLFLVPLVVFQTTHQATWSGAAFFVEALPRYLVFPFAGVLSDRTSPVKLLRASQRFRAIACLAGVAGYLLVGGIAWLVALSAVCGVLTSVGFVAREVILPQVFQQHRFEKVLSYSQLADQLGVVLGPVVAAALLGWWNWQWTVAFAAILFLIADGATLLWQRTGNIRLFPAQETAPAQWMLPIRIALSHVARLPGLKRLVMLAAAENLVIGVTLATSAAMVTGVHHEPGRFYAALQVSGAIATVVILLVIARTSIPRKMLGGMAFTAIFAGGLMAGISPSIWGYAAGFLLIVGFDKMFNVFIRSARQAIIPAHDYGKTVGVMVMLNNLTQPLAGLLVGLFSGHGRIGLVVTSISLAMGLLGAATAYAGMQAARRNELTAPSLRAPRDSR
ncbi:MFS transporter [Trinickia terrae]|uniref:MFS transporter n=1 Tax=Trinickia terrae TaxID=2571161 RepID=A0A4U1I390_9BURK|nr:MFS transporter [Trinickia terrae]TKC87711.1 MFS transporter [Trinickia terrae]